MVRAGNTLEDLLREASAATRVGDLSEAERLYRRVLDRSPANVEAWLGLGTVLAEPGRKAECFQKVLELDPGNADARASLERLQAVLPAAGSEKLHCAFHPNVETVLRCSQCGRPICVRCARPYPVGQLCPVCVRERIPLNYQPAVVNLVAAGFVALLAALLGGWLASYVVRWGFILAILAGPLVGSLIAQAALWAGQRRRGRLVQITVGACTLVGSLVAGLPILARPVALVSYGFSSIDTVLFLVYAALAASSAVAWLR